MIRSFKFIQNRDLNSIIGDDNETIVISNYESIDN